jgi:hypothetical protein
MKNLEADKMQLITPEMTGASDDPRFGDEVHIVPVEEDPKDPTHLCFGVHEFVRECACHPRLQQKSSGRMIIAHQAAVN